MNRSTASASAKAQRKVLIEQNVNTKWDVKNDVKVQKCLTSPRSASTVTARAADHRRPRAGDDGQEDATRRTRRTKPRPPPDATVPVDGCRTGSSIRVAALTSSRPAGSAFVLVGIGGHGAAGQTTLARSITDAQIVGTDEFWDGADFELPRLRAEGDRAAHARRAGGIPRVLLGAPEAAGRAPRRPGPRA